MVTYHCDGCGREMSKDDLRYKVHIDVRAAYDTLQVSLLDLVRNHRAEILALIEQMKHKDPAELERSIYAQFDMDLCPACQHTFIKHPLRFRPQQESGPDEQGFDIDAFLRSLGYGGPAKEED